MHIRHTLNALIAVALAAGFSTIPALAAEPNQASLIKQARVSKEVAARTALSKVPGGTIKSSELENEHGALVWSFDIAIPKSKNIHEILVDAKTGVIVHSEIETPKDQAKELAQDRKEAMEAKKHK